MGSTWRRGGLKTRERAAEVESQARGPPCLPEAREGKVPVSSLGPGSWLYLTASAVHRGSLLFLFWCFCGFSLLVGSVSCFIVVNHSEGGQRLPCSASFLSGSRVRPPWLGSFHSDSCGLEAWLVLLSLPPGCSGRFHPKLDAVSEEK